MGYVEALSLFAIMIPLAALPSASVLLVVARSLAGGRAHGASAAAGIVAGDLLFVIAALLGMTLLAQQLGSLFALIRYAAGAYLIYLGLRLMSADQAALPPAPAGGGLLADFLAGLLLTLGDLKAILFYASLFPLLVDLEQLTAADGLLIGLVTALAVGGTKMVYVLVAGRLAVRLPWVQAPGGARRAGGALILGCGGILIVKT